MGTVVDQLNHLNETKDLIKNAIITKGVAVADEDTFRSYPDKILAISSGSSKQARYNAAAVFYDIDGTVLYDYTKEELNNLTELPPTPVKQYPCTFDRNHFTMNHTSDWSHTLSEIKEFVNKYSYIEIGALYKAAGITTIAIEVPAEATDGIYVEFVVKVISTYNNVLASAYLIAHFNQDLTEKIYQGVSYTYINNYPNRPHPEHLIRKKLYPGMNYLTLFSPPFNPEDRDNPDSENYQCSYKAIGTGDLDYNEKYSDIQLISCNCSNLIKWSIIGSGVTTLGDVFKNSSIEYINLNNRVQGVPFLSTLDNFLGPNLKHLVVPSHMNIENNAFNEYKSLEHIILNPSAPCAIAFTSLPLKSLVLPNKVYFGGYGVYGCSSLTKLILSEGTSQILDAQLDGISIFYLKFPKIITSFGSFCANFTNVVILDFSDHEVIPSIGENIFGTLNEDSKILVPNNLLTNWMESWSEYADNIVGV